MLIFSEMFTCLRSGFVFAQRQDLRPVVKRGTTNALGWSLFCLFGDEDRRVVNDELSGPGPSIVAVANVEEKRAKP